MREPEALNDSENISKLHVETLGDMCSKFLFDVSTDKLIILCKEQVIIYLRGRPELIFEAGEITVSYEDSCLKIEFSDSLKAQMKALGII